MVVLVNIVPIVGFEPTGDCVRSRRVRNVVLQGRGI